MARLLFLPISWLEGRKAVGILAGGKGVGGWNNQWRPGQAWSLASQDDAFVLGCGGIWKI